MRTIKTKIIAWAMIFVAAFTCINLSGETEVMAAGKGYFMLYSEAPVLVEGAQMSFNVMYINGNEEKFCNKFKVKDESVAKIVNKDGRYLKGIKAGRTTVVCSYGKETCTIDVVVLPIKLSFSKVKTGVKSKKLTATYNIKNQSSSKVNIVAVGVGGVYSESERNQVEDEYTNASGRNLLHEVNKKKQTIPAGETIKVNLSTTVRYDNSKYEYSFNCEPMVLVEYKGVYIFIEYSDGKPMLHVLDKISEKKAFERFKKVWGMD